MHQSWSKLAHKCILYNNRCAKFYPDWLRFGSMRAKNLFLSKNRAQPSLCFGLAVNQSKLRSYGQEQCPVFLTHGVCAFKCSDTVSWATRRVIQLVKR